MSFCSRDTQFTLYWGIIRTIYFWIQKSTRPGGLIAVYDVHSRKEMAEFCERARVILQIPAKPNEDPNIVRATIKHELLTRMKALSHRKPARHCRGKKLETLVDVPNMISEPKIVACLRRWFELITVNVFERYQLSPRLMVDGNWNGKLDYVLDFNAEISFPDRK